MRNIIMIVAGICLMTSCSNNGQNQADELAAKQRSIDSMQNEIARKQLVDSMNLVSAAAAEAAKPVVTKERTVYVSSHNSPRKNTTTTSETNISTTNAATAPAPKQRKGLGPTATGAIIGAGAGAITGAMVSKKKGEGAVVGGVLGAGAGAGVGAIIKNSQKKKDAAAAEEANR